MGESALRRRSLGLAAIALAVLPLAGCGGGDNGGGTAKTPNILFVVMDDVGIDQMRVFGYGGETPPSTPNIDAIAHAGIRFHNTWSMPACTTSRAVFFDGRFPFRTNVYAALGPNDLANSQVSPYEITAPKLLAQRGYQSGLFGKFHLGLQENNPAQYTMPHDLGWDYFAGWLDETGDPSSIDTSAGGVAPTGTWSCGFVPAAAQGGADSGACYQTNGTCRELGTVGGIPPGRRCRDDGGILDPGAACQSPPPSALDFQTLSGHYVSPVVYNYPDGGYERVLPTDPRARTFRATFAVDEAIDWITSRPAGQPWMASVTFASAHTPVMQPPVGQVPDEPAGTSALDCGQVEGQRVITNLMVESLDAELGRLLVATGLARRDRDGRLVYRPGQTDTMIVILGDNGTLGNTVKAPFNPQRAKGTAYQTGVWVPLVVAGPVVREPDRVVPHMVNIADLFQLFGELAGLDVHAAVPRPIDSQAMLPYLTHPGQRSIRTSNFTEVGPNLQANGGSNGPCTISQSCTQIPVSKSVCHDNNGTWWGAEPDDPNLGEAGLARCCDVNAYQATLPNGMQYTIQPDYSLGIRNDRYKIVENITYEYVSQDDPCELMTEQEFYEIDQAVPVPRLDNADQALNTDDLTPEQQRNYDTLRAQLDALLASAVPCPGDGNLDMVVNQLDLDDWQTYTAPTWGFSSVYDINLDGLTDDVDKGMIEQYLGTDCRP